MLVDKVMKKFKLENKEHAVAMTINAIKSLPVDQAWISIDNVGARILKHIAWTIADHKGKEQSYEAHKADVASLEDALTSDPNNTQAKDQLETYAKQGSEVAKETLKKLNLTGEESANNGNVLPIGGSSASVITQATT